MEITTVAYSGLGEEDVLLARWYGQLKGAGELAKVFGSDTLYEFLDGFQKPATLIYGVDRSTADVVYAFWVELTIGVSVGLWTREDVRSNRSIVASILKLYEMALGYSPTIVSCTGHPKTVDSMVKIGYTIVGKIPRLWSGEDVWLLYLTKESFARAKGVRSVKLEKVRQAKAVEAKGE